MRSARRPALLALAVLLALACDQLPIAEIGLPQAGGGLPVTVFVPAGVDPAVLGIALDGQDVRPLFTARTQILQFFSTALAGGAPQIIDPLP
jgi:hypothetical protein